MIKAFVQVAGLLLLTHFAEAHGLGVLRARVIGVGQDETVSYRKVEFTVSTCSRDRLSDTAKVKVIRQGEQLPSSVSSDGCIRWADKVGHLYYSPEKLSRLDYEIVINGKTEKAQLFVNPWDDKFTFGFDDREFADPAQFMTSKKVSGTPVRLMVEDLKLRSTTPNGDQLVLNLSIVGRSLGYHGLINTRRMSENLRTGDYVVKIEILDEKGVSVQQELRHVLVTDASAEFSLIVPSTISKDSAISLSIEPLDTFGTTASASVQPVIEVKSFRLFGR